MKTNNNAILLILSVCVLLLLVISLVGISTLKPKHSYYANNAVNVPANNLAIVSETKDAKENNDDNTKASEYLSYYSQPMMINLVYPSTWTLNDNLFSPSRIVITPPGALYETKFKDGFSIVISAIPDLYPTLADASEYVYALLETSYDDYNLIESTDAQLSGLNGKSMMIEGRIGNADIKEKNRFIIIDNKVYLARYVMQTANFNKFLEEGNFMMDSLTIG